MSLLVEYWKSKAKLSYLSVNKTSPGNKKEKFVKNFFTAKNCGLSVQSWSWTPGAGAAILSSWSRFRVTMERLHNTGVKF